MKINHPFYTKDFEEIEVWQLRAGDEVLCRYYDANGEYVEELWTVETVRERRYGRGSRMLVKWAGAAKEDSYPIGTPLRFGRRVVK